MSGSAKPVVSRLFCYPVKSLGGIELESANVTELGIEHDREWLVVDPAGMFLTQRQIARMALVGTALAPGQLTLKIARRSIHVPLERHDGRTIEVQVWDSRTTACEESAEASDLLSQFLGRRVRLVRLAPGASRVTKSGLARYAFADAYPFLFLGEASLDDLNRRLETPLPLNRFRPNVVVSRTRPYAEDEWKEATIGPVTFVGETLCVRCPITTTDQETAIRGKEPLATLATYRKTEDGVVFARNFSHRGTGTIRVGDTIDAT